MKKILGFFVSLICIFALCGCDGGPLYDVHYPKPVVVEPDQETRYTINGYVTTPKPSQVQINSSTNSDNDSEEEKLIGNKNTKMLHKLGCSYTKKLKDENAEFFDSLDDGILNGYSKCSRCFK